MPEGGTLNLSEVFAAVQGEGRHLGEPCIFIRTSGCNLRCSWGTTRCDTPYASWDAEENPVPLNLVLDQVQSLQVDYPKIRRVVVTGGEPLLQPALPSLVYALQNQYGMMVSMETNGTLKQAVPVNFVSLSPKLASSIPLDPEWASRHNEQRINLDALRFWVEHYDYQFKFVVNDESDESEILAILRHLSKVAGENVYLMPQGVDANQLIPRSRLCIELALRHGWRYTPRAQIEVFGNERGT